MAGILVVDDDELVRFALSESIRENGFAVTTASGGPEAIELFGREEFDAVLMDLKMPGMDGITAMKELRDLDPDIPIIIVTAHGDIPTAVEAIKVGAYDFVEKPPQISRLMVTLKRAAEKLELARRVKRLDSNVETSLEGLLGRSPAMKKVIEQIQHVAWSDFSIIIQGETGTGKSFAANAIHNISRRAERQFIKVDMRMIPDSLVESELFGFERGSFTGAERKRKGYFELADGGTIFIDELQNIPSHMQTRLLTAVEEKKIYPLGAMKPLAIDVRIIAATNVDIKKSVAAGDFREDLFFRLGEFEITLPPLRERLEDIPFFARKFLTEAAAELDKPFKDIDDAALDHLLRYAWPGNVRELKNVMRKAALISASGVIMKKDILFMSDALHEKGDTVSLFPLRDAVAEIEKKAIRQALQIAKGKKTRATAMLMIDYKTLAAKMKEYGIE